MAKAHALVGRVCDPVSCAGLSDLEILQAVDTAHALTERAWGHSWATEALHDSPTLGLDASRIAEKAAAQCFSLEGDPRLFAALEGLELSGAPASAQAAQARLCSELRKNGAHLEPAARQAVATLRRAVASLERSFIRNIASGHRNVPFDEAALEGVPLEVLGRLPRDDAGRVLIRTNAPELNTALKHCRSAAVRERLWRETRTVGYPKNLKVLGALLEARHALATTVGYRNYAHLELSGTMVGDEARAASFLDQCSKEAMGPARARYAALLAEKQREEPTATKLYPWDTLYFGRLLDGTPALGLHSAYLGYSEARDGILRVTEAVFGLRIERTEKVFREDVESYDVSAQGKLLGRLHLDMHRRAGKAGGDFHRLVCRGKAGVATPESLLHCSFPVDSDGRPAPLEPLHLRIFFHELGHALHHLFSGQGPFVQLSGVRGSGMDFLEVPSVLFEHWADEPQVLARIARHHQSGEAMPAALLSSLSPGKPGERTALAAQERTLEAALSLALHAEAPVASELAARASELRGRHCLIPEVEGDWFFTSLSHLANYGPALYNFEWAERISKQLLARFEDRGLLEAKTGARFAEEVLASTDVPPTERLGRFLGQPLELSIKSAD